MFDDLICLAAMALVSPDGVNQIGRSPIMEEEDALPDAPQGSLGERCEPEIPASDKWSPRRRSVRELNNKLNSTAGKRPPVRNSKRTDLRGTRVENLILSQIPDPEYNLIRPYLESIETQDYEILHDPGERLDYAYFPNRGMISDVFARTSSGELLDTSRQELIAKMTRQQVTGG
jgi:hypothetical protein